VKTSIATVSLAGDLGAKLEAIAAAGFDGFELFDADLTSSHLSPADVRRRAADLGLHLFALQPFRDFEGMLDSARGAAFQRAHRKFDLMELLGTDLLLVPSNVSPHAVDGASRAANDLHELGDLAAARGFRVAFEALAWGRHVRDWTAAWDIVQRADHSSVGLVLDTYHLFVRGNAITPLRDVPAKKLFIVQLADAPSLDMEVLRHSRHLRNFPGQGDYPVSDVIEELLGIGYDGVLSHEIFNDEFRVAPPRRTAVDGYRSMIWLEEQALRRAVRPRLVGRLPGSTTSWTNAPRPIPDASVTGFAFLEFAVADEAAGADLGEFLTRVGFRQTHRHRTKRVDLFRNDGAWIAINVDRDPATASFARERSGSVCGFGLSTSNAEAAIARARIYGCDEIVRARGFGEAQIPAIGAIGESLVYLVDENAPHFTETDFEPIAPTLEASGPSMVIDHIAQAVAPHELLSVLLFYRTVLGLDLQPPLELVDPSGIVTSRTVISPNGAVRIPLNTAASGSTSPERFRAAANGSGVQHVAFATDNINVVAATIDPALILPIPENYYADLRARFELTSDEIDHLRTSRLLYDRIDDGEYLHLYTVGRSGGLFFEFVQRHDYAGFGAANAPIRMAAQSLQDLDAAATAR
jgi:4-hydroxyphenylpyruvate dioxygenase